MTANTDTLSRLFPLANLEALEARINKLNRKATKNGFTPVVLTVGNKGIIYRGSRTFHTNGQYGIESVTNYYTFDTVEKYEAHKGDKWTIEAVNLEVTTTTIGFDGYRLVGLTEDVEGIHTLNVFEKQFDLKDERGTCKCDHCNINRNRTKVYFVADEYDKITRLGSSCVTLFFPKVVNPLNAFSFDTEIASILGDIDDEDNWGRKSYATPTFAPKLILQYTLHLVNNIGWVSSRAAYNSGDEVVGTKVPVINALLSGDPTEKLAEEDLKAVEAKAEAILAWAETVKDDNDFLTTVWQIIEAGYTPTKLIGYVVGLFGFYQSTMIKQATKEEQKTSEWVGEVKERTSFTGEIKRINSFETCYGVKYLHTIITKDGNVITHWRNGSTLGTEGETIEFTATIKKHDEYYGVKQTVVQRPAKVKVV